MSLVSTAVVIAGRYRLDHQLASDDTAEVWQGADVELACPVAVKLLRPDAGDADLVGQFRVAARRAGPSTSSLRLPLRCTFCTRPGSRMATSGRERSCTGATALLGSPGSAVHASPSPSPSGSPPTSGSPPPSDGAAPAD